jgi:hypothetical protein
VKKLKKIIASLIILLLAFWPVIGPAALYAEDAEPSSSPSPAPTETAITNETQVNNEVDSGAITGENTITEPSPSPEATLLTEPLPTPDPSASPAIEITTGDSVTVTEVTNQVNTTEVNAQVIYRTLNIFLDGDIDLTDSNTLQSIVNQVITENPETATITVNFDGTNIAYVSNEIISVADSGGNNIASATDSTITTGDAISVVSLLNQVNTTIINSQIYLVTINIFGDVNANIILPELTAGEPTPCCDQNIAINNQAVVNNQVASQAVSGQNTVVATTEASIETGDAASTVNVVNVVNTSYLNTSIAQLIINVLGEWIGSWLGADEWVSGSANTGCAGCIDNISLNNQAVVDNEITSLAVSGGNTVSAASGQIKTGNAYSSVSLFNFINTSFINSTGFWGFINIFGRLTGNVGTKTALFPEPSPAPSAPPESLSEDTLPATAGPASRETGGLLTMEQTNNVGEYVLPGDTVTFNVLIKNQGGGRVYDAKLWLGLTQNNEDKGGGWIHVGDIEPKKGVKISTGLVLSQLADGGEYTGIAKVIGYVGPDNQEVTAQAESRFLLAAFSPLIESTLGLAAPVEAGGNNVLGSTIAAGITPYERLLRLFWIMLALYLLLLAIEKREKLAYTAVALRSLIFSLLALIKTP